MNPTDIMILKALGETPQSTPRQEKAQVKEIVTLTNQGKDPDHLRDQKNDQKEIPEIDGDQDPMIDHTNKDMKAIT